MLFNKCFLRSLYRPTNKKGDSMQQEQEQKQEEPQEQKKRNDLLDLFYDLLMEQQEQM